MSPIFFCLSHNTDVSFCSLNKHCNYSNTLCIGRVTVSDRMKPINLCIKIKFLVKYIFLLGSSSSFHSNLNHLVFNAEATIIAQVSVNAHSLH